MKCSVPPTDRTGQSSRRRTTSTRSSAPCVTRWLYATEDEIGQQKTCPDCHSVVEITPPRPKPRRVNEVLDTDYEGQLFALSEPVSREIYETAESGQNPKTMGEQALRNAEREYDRQVTRRRMSCRRVRSGRASFDFSRTPRSCCGSWWPRCCWGAWLKLTLATVAWSSAGGTEWFLALMGTTALIALMVLSVHPDRRHLFGDSAGFGQRAG